MFTVQNEKESEISLSSEERTGIYAICLSKNAEFQNLRAPLLWYRPPVSAEVSGCSTFSEQSLWGHRFGDRCGKRGLGTASGFSVNKRSSLWSRHVCVCVCVCVCARARTHFVAQSCLTFCDPLDCSSPDSSVGWILYLLSHQGRPISYVIALYVYTSRSVYTIYTTQYTN